MKEIIELYLKRPMFLSEKNIARSVLGMERTQEQHSQVFYLSTQAHLCQHKLTSNQETIDQELKSETEDQKAGGFTKPEARQRSKPGQVDIREAVRKQVLESLRRSGDKLAKSERSEAVHLHLRHVSKTRVQDTCLS